MPSNPLEHVMSSMGKSRDLDGTVDRCADPPEILWPILYALKVKCEDENIELVSLFEVSGRARRRSRDADARVRPMRAG